VIYAFLAPVFLRAAMGLPRATPVHHITRNCQHKEPNHQSLLASHIPSLLCVSNGSTYAEKEESNQNIPKQQTVPAPRLSEQQKLVPDIRLVHPHQT